MTGKLNSPSLSAGGSFVKFSARLSWKGQSVADERDYLTRVALGLEPRFEPSPELLRLVEQRQRKKQANPGRP